MRLAISSTGKELSSKIDPRFGRTAYIVVYDTDSDDWEVVDNTGSGQLAHGAGVQTAQTVVNSKVDLVVSGNYGPNAFQILNAAGIKAAQVGDLTVAEVVDKAKKNELMPLGQASTGPGGPRA